MPTAILGRKVGMTRYYDGEGRNVPVTVIEAGPCLISQIKTEEVDGYAAVQLAFEDLRPRRSTIPMIGHDANAGSGPMRFHREVRFDGPVEGVELGESVTVEAFEAIKFVDVIGTSKGKGTAGVMKRHRFRGQEASHGVERKHRSPGSIGGRSSNLGTGKPKKGIRMAGRMGNERVTVRSLPVIGIDKERNLLLVKGPVPGPKSGLLMVREAKRLFKRKAKQLEA
ncbi:MAG: 50S ribosomal protein L3 [Phycisphaeraceae bacterium]